MIAADIPFESSRRKNALCSTIHYLVQALKEYGVPAFIDGDQIRVKSGTLVKFPLIRRTFSFKYYAENEVVPQEYIYLGYTE